MNADGMLRLFAAEPTLLPLAPEGAGGPEIERRVQDEIHACAYCGDLAQTAAIVQVPGEQPRTGRPVKRWLDLCMPHFGDVRQAADTPENPAREATRQLAENLRGVADSMKERIADLRREIDKQVIADHPDLGGAHTEDPPA